jgi:nucleoside-triphosphatase THEP1
MVLTEEEIISGLKKGTSFLLTGPAGVGKTYLIKKIYEKLKEEGVSVALTSTTGINALNLGGITVHKLFGLVNRSDMAYINTMKASFLFKGIKMRLQKLKVIIVDEISMLRSDTFELINRILQLCLENNKPLGGMSFIFTGDFFQIPPVVKQSENHTNQ